jgi:sucrose-6-phosphate hydrolase SacC (GH32 family)
MKWRKMGLVYAPDRSRSWSKKYAFPPTPYFVADNVLRLYVAFCDENTVGRIGFVEVRADNPSQVLRVSPEPVLDIGTPGAFDENGVLPTCIVTVGKHLYLYYVGYQLGHKVRYFQFQGLAVSQDGGNSFTRSSKVPVIERSDKEMLNRTSAFVMLENGVFKMWYVGGSQWVNVNGKSLPRYNLRYLESPDGNTWGDEGRVCLDFHSPDEHAFGRPWVVKDGGRYRMFYSVRTHSKGYRLGYAESLDGLAWERNDAALGLNVSPAGWDSQMIAYSSLVRYRDAVYLFYNGNNCGETGFGYAVLEEW